MKLNCIIVDDEEGSHYILNRYIEDLDYAVVTGSFYNTMDALAYLDTNRADVILLDINMPEQDGFALLDQLHSKASVIFTTAYSEYAMKAFEYNAVDYLHKPIHFERFSAAMEKARVMSELLSKPASVDHIQIRSDGRMIQLRIKDIIYIESLGNYIKVHTPQKTYMPLMPLTELEQLLPGERFARIHKSYIVNIDLVTGVTSIGALIQDRNLPIGRTYKQLFLKKMERR